MKIRSTEPGCERSNARTASAPVDAARTSAPAMASTSVAISRLSSLSSATMTRLPEKSYETPSPCVRDRAANASSHVAAPSPEARPNGTSTVKVDPFPTSLDNDIRPPIISVNRFVMARPRPVPPRLHEDSSPCSKDENIRSRFSGLMPQPVSVTEKRSQIASSCAASSSGGAGSSSMRSVTLPSRGVNLKALPTRL